MTPQDRARRRPLALGWAAWLKKLTLPPAGPLLLASVSLAFGEPWRTAGMVFGLGALWLLATPFVGLALLRRLEHHGPLDLEAFEPRPESDAIVVLDGGRYVRTLGGESVKPETLERLRHAAAIHRRTGLPILATGDGAGPLMGTVLERDFGVEARWLEVESRITQESADRSAAVLRGAGVGRIVLVTHAWHMPRSVGAFERTGLDVVPAPFGFAGPDRQELRVLALVPSAGGLLSTWRALHEWVGLAWYAWRYRPSSRGPRPRERTR